MFFLLYQSMDADGQYIPVLNLMRYLTFRTGMALFTAQLVCVMMGSRFIRWIQAKQGRGQPIRIDGVERHLLEKTGTPTMGGFMILAGVMVGTLLWADLSNPYVWIVLMVTGSFGILGFLDDYAKVAKQTSAGVSGKVKLLVQFTIAALAVWFIILVGAAEPRMPPGMETSIAFPSFKELLWNIGWFYLLFGMVVIGGFSNAVNLTDGLDGLAIVPVMIAAAAFGLITYLIGNVNFADYLQVHYVPGTGELAIICGALIGAGLGFLWYNAPPAGIFMGDTGSLALGGALGTMAVVTKHEIVLGIIGGLFVLETVSVMIQVAYFKATHHHFEKLGWRESQIVIRFWIIAAVLALIGLATLKLR